MNRSRHADGLVIAVCRGQRCAALRELRGPDAGIEPLKSAVSRTRGAILISTGCLGRCSLAAVVVLAWQGQVGCEAIPLAGMDALDRSRALTTWLSGTGPATTLLHGARLPAPLAAAQAAATRES
jgi:hypothetical protein